MKHCKILRGFFWYRLPANAEGSIRGKGGGKDRAFETSK
jgi:hypothetical protein